MSDRLDFIRKDLAQLAAYKPHPEGVGTAIVDRLDTNESPLDLPAEIKSKLVWAYQEEIEANRYPDGSHEALKQAIAEYVNESAHLVGVSANSVRADEGLSAEPVSAACMPRDRPVISPDRITPANISVGNGSDELIRSLLIATCLGGSGSILVAIPTFSMYGILARTLGIPVVTVPRQDNFALDLALAQDAIEQTENPPIRVVFVVHPNSPTGNALRTEELNWLKSLPENILVVIDEAYFEFSQHSTVSELGEHHNWIVLRTFSKAFRLAAHRVGYAIANPNLINVLEKVRLPYNLPSFSQLAAKVALQQRQLLLPLVTETITERERVYALLNQDPRFKVWQSQANFLYLRLNDIKEEYHEQALADIVKKLKAVGTSIRHTGGGLRITIGTSQENNRTLAKLKTVTT